MFLVKGPGGHGSKEKRCYAMYMFPTSWLRACICVRRDMCPPKTGELLTGAMLWQNGQSSLVNTKLLVPVRRWLLGNSPKQERNLVEGDSRSCILRAAI